MSCRFGHEIRQVCKQARPAVALAGEATAAADTKRSKLAGGMVLRRSITLVKRLGFKKEGFSPRYLKISDVWCDHERWALLADEPFA